MDGVSEQVAIHRPFAGRRRVGKVRLLVEWRPKGGATPGMTEAARLLRKAVGHLDVEVGIGESDLAHARACRIDLGAGNDSGAGQEIVEVAGDVRHTRDASFDLRRETTKRIDAR